MGSITNLNPAATGDSDSQAVKCTRCGSHSSRELFSSACMEQCWSFCNRIPHWQGQILCDAGMNQIASSDDLLVVHSLRTSPHTRHSESLQARSFLPLALVLTWPNQSRTDRTLKVLGGSVCCVTLSALVPNLIQIWLEKPGTAVGVGEELAFEL